MNFNWKKSAFVTIDIALAIYLVLAVTAFNNPDEKGEVCSEVNINIEEGVVKGFLTANDIKNQLQYAKLYPLGDPMEKIETRKIEDHLTQNPFIEKAECYKTQTGRIYISLTQRMPVARVKADNGDDYYVDTEGNIMPNTHYVSNMLIVTGHVTKKYARAILPRIGNFIINDKLWQHQVEQLNVLNDGSIELVPRVGNHVVYLGQPTDIPTKLNRLEKFYRFGLSKAGWNKYSYINVEFDNQIICKKR